jgi:hypothetical protein
MVSRLAGGKALPADLLDQILDKERDGHERTEDRPIMSPHSYL